MATALPRRQDITPEICWDLSRLFASPADCEKALKAFPAQARDFADRYENNFAQLSTEEAARCLDEYNDLLRTEIRLGNYPSLWISVDRGDNEAQRLYGLCQQVLSQASATLSFFTQALSDLDDQTLAALSAARPAYARFLQLVRRRKPHLLSSQTEAALAALHPSLSLPIETYEISKATDMQFPNFEANGQSYPLSYVLYENNYCGENETAVRREAFKAFSETLGHYRNTVATIYNAQVQQEKIMAGLRGYDSVYDYLLFEQQVPRELYDRQIDLIMSELAPHMRRYAKLLQQAHQLDEMHYADLKLTLDPAYNPQVSIEESRQYIDEAMKPMGEAYRQMVMRFWPERWCDFAQNQGKSTGGYCSVPNGKPFILLNWSGDLSEVFTLAHELGHAAQGVVTQEHEAPVQDDFSWYDVEAPSTFHEMLLSKSLMQKSSEPRFRRWVVSSMIANTYYHNFVTHLLEAAYQREVYRRVDAGENLSADDFDAIYLKTLKTFWGDDIILDEGAERTWMRQPHYYMGLYSYTYSASLVISTEFYQRLMSEGEKIVPEWLAFLKTGAMAPIEHARLAGIDITSDGALKRTIAFIGSLVDELEKLA